MQIFKDVDNELDFDELTDLGIFDSMKVLRLNEEEQILFFKHAGVYNKTIELAKQVKEAARVKLWEMLTARLGIDFTTEAYHLTTIGNKLVIIQDSNATVTRRITEVLEHRKLTSELDATIVNKQEDTCN